MIVHQAERTARTIAHAHHAQPQPQAGEDTAGAPAALAPVATDPIGGPPDTSPGMSIHTAMGRGLGSVLNDERRNWWSPTNTRARFDHRGGEASGRWPAAASDEPRLGRQALRADPESPALARAFTRETLTGWRLGHLCDEAMLVVSELVTNALCHGLDGALPSSRQCPVQVVLLCQRRRLVAVVSDPGEGVPLRTERGPAAENGRGLHVVDAVSSAWGWAPLATGGKAVWAALEITPIAGVPSRHAR